MIVDNVAHEPGLDLDLVALVHVPAKLDSVGISMDMQQNNYEDGNHVQHKEIPSVQLATSVCECPSPSAWKFLPCKFQSPPDQLYEQKHTCKLLGMSSCVLFEQTNNSKVIIHARATSEGNQLKHFGHLGSIRGMVCYQETRVVYSFHNQCASAYGLVKNAWVNSWLELLLLRDDWRPPWPLLELVKLHMLGIHCMQATKAHSEAFPCLEQLIPGIFLNVLVT